jgi:hypothetical protein
VAIFVRTRPDVDPYFPVPMPDPPVGWQRAWFLLRNNTNAPLPAFMGSHPIPHPNWGYGEAQTDLRSGIVAKRTDGLFYSAGSKWTASSTRSDRADANGTKMSRLPLLHGVRHYRDQHPDTRGSCSWGRSDFWPQPGTPKGEGLSYPVLRKRERSLHTCAQDVQITRMAKIDKQMQCYK